MWDFFCPFLNRSSGSSRDQTDLSCHSRCFSQLSRSPPQTPPPAFFFFHTLQYWQRIYEARLRDHLCSSNCVFRFSFFFPTHLVEMSCVFFGGGCPGLHTVHIMHGAEAAEDLWVLRCFTSTVSDSVKAWKRTWMSLRSRTNSSIQWNYNNKKKNYAKSTENPNVYFVKAKHISNRQNVGRGRTQTCRIGRPCIYFIFLKAM